MRFLGVLVVISAFVVGALPAQAYENFIPLGTGYSSSVNTIPAIKSERQRIIEQTDIYESEIYNKQLEERNFQARSSAFFNDAAAFSSDRSIDY